MQMEVQKLSTKIFVSDNVNYIIGEGNRTFPEASRACTLAQPKIFADFDHLNVTMPEDFPELEPTTKYWIGYYTTLTRFCYQGMYMYNNMVVCLTLANITVSKCLYGFYWKFNIPRCNRYFILMFADDIARFK